MARRNTGFLEDLILVASRLPWWVCVLLGIISYFVLHGIASRPAVTIADPGHMGDTITRSFITTLAMIGQYILPLVFGVAALFSGINSAKQKKLYNNIESRSDVAAMNEISWQDFERLIAEYYRRNGFTVNREGGNGPDGGMDLILRKNQEMYLVQCKQWKAYKVGVQPVRELYGVMASRGADGGYFITSGFYTEDALAFVQGLNIELIDGRKLRRMIDAAHKNPVVAVPVKSQQIATNPACPKCGEKMTKRVARQGKHAGMEFWGCTDFPKCNGTLPL